MLKKLKPAAKLTLTYLVVCTSWILLSDWFVEKLAGNNLNFLQKAQNIKGIAFVCVYALLLYITSNKLYKRIERSLKKSNESLNKYLALIEATKECVIEHDLPSDTAFINERMKICLGVHSNIIKSFSTEFKNRIHPNNLEKVITDFNRALEQGINTWQIEHQLLCKNNQYIQVINSGYIIQNALGKPVRIISVIQDISELQALKTNYYEQQLKHKEEISLSVIKAQENERNRWAMELHDNVSQKLTAANLFLDVARQQTPAEFLTEAQRIIKTTIDDIRQLSASIKPPELSTFTLLEAIQELFYNISRVKPIRFTFNADGFDETQLSNYHELMIYRVIQEQLNNIIKYANASEVIVNLFTKDREVHIEVIDNGIGFNVNNAKGGLGLRNIKNRLQAFNGNMHIQSAEQEGCKLSAVFSLQ